MKIIKVNESVCEQDRAIFYRRHGLANSRYYDYDYKNNRELETAVFEDDSVWYELTEFYQIDDKPYHLLLIISYWNSDSPETKYYTKEVL